MHLLTVQPFVTANRFNGLCVRLIMLQTECYMLIHFQAMRAPLNISSRNQVYKRLHSKLY